MKIWGKNLKVGDTIYYEYDYDIRQSTVKERDNKTFMMPSLILENGNRIFINDYYYTEKQEVIDNILEELKNKCKSKLEDIDKQQKLLKISKSIIEDKLKELDKFTDADQRNGMRNLIDVIDEMLSVIPIKEKMLIAFFKDIKESQRVRAPEDMTGWWEISDELGRMLNEFDDIPKLLRRILIPEWKLKLFSIFSTQSLDEIKNDIYG